MIGVPGARILKIIIESGDYTCLHSHGRGCQYLSETKFNGKCLCNLFDQVLSADDDGKQKRCDLCMTAELG